MRFLHLIFLFASLSLLSCEELIDINLNEADPRYVIEADLSNLRDEQAIYVSQTVAFDAPVKNTPVNNAVISVRDDKGNTYTFTHQANGRYTSPFKPKEKTNYSLLVNIDGEIFESSSYMNDYIDVRSTGITEDVIFSDTLYSVSLKFDDPKNTPNYYKYNISINGGDFTFSSVFNDKFNDGLTVTHEIADRRNNIELGDSVTVQRQVIDKGVYDYWNDLQSINPGSAAPANPKSNISNGALGYFSVSSSKIYGFRISFN